MTDTNISTSKLLDEENKLAEERRALISKVTLEIEKIFLREDLTMGELTEVMNLFNARAQSVFSQTKIEDIKHSYDKLIK